MNICHNWHLPRRNTQIAFLLMLLAIIIASGANARAYIGSKVIKQKTLLQAVRAYDISTVKRLLEKGSNVDTTDSDGSTALIYASGGIILEPTLDKEKRKAKITILRSVNESICSLLISYKCNVNVADTSGLTALHNAVIWGNINTIKLLITHGADVNRKDNNGNTALHIAAMWHSYGIIRLLVENGALVNQKDNNGNTALHHTLRKGYSKEIVDFLLSSGADNDCLRR